MTQKEFWIKNIIPMMVDNTLGKFRFNTRNIDKLSNYKLDKNKLLDIFNNKNDSYIFIFNDSNLIGSFRRTSHDWSMEKVKNLSSSWYDFYTDIELFIRNNKIDNFLN